MFAKLEQAVQLGGLAPSTLLNYGRCIAKISLYFKRIPTELEAEQIDGYLQFLISESQPSKSYFKHTVYGLRLLFRLYGLNDKVIKLPSLKRDHKLPVVLSQSQVKTLLKAGRILKHRVFLSLVYSSGLRSCEARSLKISDVDFDRMMIHIRATKYNKDRYVPLSRIIALGLKKYFLAYNPQKYLFNGKQLGSQLSPRGAQWAMREALKRSGISKNVTLHTLRHSYATHLLEMGLDIDSVRKLLGHQHLSTTLIYLHVARVKSADVFSPLDKIYEKHLAK